MRKSFILHIDSLSILDKMNNEQAGIFIKTLYEYQASGKLPELDFAMNMALTPFFNQFSRDAEKYKKVAERNKNNGLKGGRPKTQNNPLGLSGLKNNPKKPKKADNDNDNDNDIKKDLDKSKSKENVFSEFENFWKEYPKTNASKKKTLEIFTNLMKKGEGYEEIIRGATRYAEHCRVSRTESQYIKHATTWLNQRCWETEYSGRSFASGNSNDKHDRARAAINEALAEMGVPNI